MNLVQLNKQKQAKRGALDPPRRARGALHLAAGGEGSGGADLDVGAVRVRTDLTRRTLGARVCAAQRVVAISARDLCC